MGNGAIKMGLTRKLGAAVTLAALALVPAAASAAKRNGDERLPRIVGGGSVSIEEVPWQVALTVDPFDGGAAQRQICGGTLVAPTAVITAAHCVYGDNGFQAARRFGVVSGRTTLSSSAGQEQQVRAIHYPTDNSGRPLYNNQATTWDVVVLELSEPAAGTPIQIAGPDERALWAAGQPAIISGWGSITSGNNYPDNLHAARVHIATDSTCRNLFGSGYQREVMVCATGTPADTCPGDSGGPLVVGATDGSVRLVGDTSYGTGRCGTAAGSVYGRLADDPIRSYLRSVVYGFAGVDIVGSGGQPADPPVPPGGGSDTLDREAALASAWSASKRACYADRYCVRYGAFRCSPRGAGYRCTIVNLERAGRSRYTCFRAIAFTQKHGKIRRMALSRWQCYRGWRTESNTRRA
jgi:hypothetical protein